jgi:hypothetical protein
MPGDDALAYAAYLAPRQMALDLAGRSLHFEHGRWRWRDAVTSPVRINYGSSRGRHCRSRRAENSRPTDDLHFDIAGIVIGRIAELAQDVGLKRQTALRTLKASGATKAAGNGKL